MREREYEPGNNLEKCCVKHQWVITSITPTIYIARECTGCPKKQKDARSQMVGWKSYIYNMVICF